MPSGRIEPFPGIAEVARVAGVSYMTVSRVINGRKGVSEDTRRRILRLLDEMGYRPNLLARALRTGRTRSIGVIGYANALRGPSNLLFSAQLAARAAGFSVTVITVADQQAEALSLAIAEMHERAVEAIILFSPYRSSGAALRRVRSTVPIVAIWGPEEIGIPVISYDHPQAAAMATQHLLDLGHPTVRHISGPTGWTGSDLRVVGWRDALSAAGREIPQVVVGDWQARSGYKAGCAILAEPDVSAVFISSDQMALGFMAAAHELGRRIPDDLSVVGYDNDPGSEYFSPPLTTVHQDFAVIGQRAFDVARSLIESPDKPPPDVTALVPELVIRATTGPYCPRA
ncbi:MAG: LacI family DNA-binding transcriptional regulator [Propionibacteriaceae bacterium]|nr:LacI family DNA-binding transcriptional regulator [Propionibacteriaceae bacterium]